MDKLSFDSSKKLYIYSDDAGIKEIKKELEYIMFIYYILWNE